MNILEQLQQLSPQKLEQFNSLLKHDSIDCSLSPIGINETSDAPLSNVQQSLLFLNQLVPESPAYNREHALRIKGALDISILRKTLAYIHNRHDILRSAYVNQDNIARQYVIDNADIKLDFIDLSHLETKEAVNTAIQLATDESIRPFDLGTGQIFRTILYKLGEQDYIFLMVIHHIAIDDYSERILTKELSTIYTALFEDSVIELPELPISYRDYSAWERARVDNQYLEHQIHYWTEYLRNTPAHLDICSDRPRPSIVSFKGYTEDFDIEPDIYTQLIKLSSQMDSTLYMILLAAYQILLYRYSRQQNFVVATEISIRNKPELEHLLGCIANVIAIKADFASDYSFEDILERVSKDALGAFANQDVPFETLVEQLHPKRDMSYNPIFQTSFDLLHGSFTENLNIYNLDISELRIQKHSSKYDLGLVMTAGNDKLTGSVEYNSDLFDLSTIENMLHAFKELIRTIIEDPKAKLSELITLTTSESKLILHDWSHGPVLHINNTLSIHQLFEQQVGKYHEKTAVSFNSQELNYQDLNDQANQLAHHLICLGVSAETKVAICLEPSLNMLIAVLGVLKAGSCYIPVDPLYPQGRIEYMLNDSATRYVISQTSVAEAISFSSSYTLVLVDAHNDDIFIQSKQAPVIPHDPDTLAYIIYTSGSTGKPKGVMVHHHAVVNFLCSMAKEPGLNHEDRLLAVTTLSFDIAVLELFLPIITGGTVVIATPEQANDGNKLAKLIQQENISIMQATPATWRLLVTSGWQGNSKLKALCGGEALQQDLVKYLLPKTSELWNMYGPTETTVWSTCYRVISTDQPTLIGKPINNTCCYVLTENLQPAPVGVPGELYIGGSGISKGYLHREELTAERFIANPFCNEKGSKLYRTGDLVKYCRDGNLEYIQRIDNQVKVRGFRIELGEIETVIAGQDSIVHTSVVVREERTGDPRIIAYIVLAPGASLTPTEIRKNIRKMLPDYMIPQYFIEMDQLPLTPNGKIDKNALPLPFASTLNDNELIAPRNHKERVLAELWADVLGIQYEKISAHDNFYEIGGHSLLSMQVVSRLRNMTSTTINVSDIVLSSLEHIAARCEFINEEPAQHTAQQAIEKDRTIDSKQKRPLLKSLLKLISSR